MQIKDLMGLPYITCCQLSKETEKDAINLLIANGKNEVATHSLSVSKICRTLALRFGLDADIAGTAGILHDISNIMKAEDMLKYSITHKWELDEAEKRHPSILHQRLSAVIARDYFEIKDKTILSAIECHSTLKSEAREYDMILFVSDKLSWDQDENLPLHDLMRSALDQSITHASLAFIHYALENNMVLYPHSWFINAKTWLEEKCALS